MDGIDTKGGVPTRNERGAALMIVLILLLGLTVLGAAGLTMTGNDIRHSENVEASTEMFYAADAGLQRYLGETNNGSSAVVYTVGSAAVTVTPTAMGTLSGGQDMFRVRSVANRTDARGVTTSRAVSALAIYQAGSGVTVTAALASGTGLSKNGTSGAIDGNDHSSLTDATCPASPGVAVAGVSVPTGGYSQSGGGKKATPVPTGNPDIEYLGSGTEVLEATGIDWESLSAGGGGMADYVIPPDSWPNFGSLPADAWPVIYMDGDVTLGPGNTGRGTVIVRGDLTMSGSFQWDGLVLVGGAMTSNGNQTITGGMVTGLNILLGESVGTSDVGNGTKKFLFNSCYVQVASTGLASGGGMVMIPGSWDEEL